MSMSEKPISAMTDKELRFHGRELYKDGYSRMYIFYLLDGKISERQIRKIFKEAQINPILKQGHIKNMKSRKGKINLAVKDKDAELKARGMKTTAKGRTKIKKAFQKQSLSGMYKRNHPERRRYMGREGTYRRYIEAE